MRDMLRTIISIWRDFSSQMKKQNISAYASSTAFFLFLSVIPMLMVVCAVIPYTPVTEQNLITALTDVTPDIADAMVESLVVDVYESSVGILPVALIAMVWWAVLILLFGLIYTYIPDTKLKFTEQVPGACFAAVVWSVFSWGFSMYVSYGNGYSIYGSLTIIVIIMLWMYFCMYIILIGAYLNRYFRPVNRVLVNHASSKSELARENRRRIREIKKIQRRKKHYTEIDRDPKEKDENLTDRN